MSTIEIKMYSLVCDGCGVDINLGADMIAWRDDQTSLDIADDNGWLLREDGRDWCPECCEWDEDGNERHPRVEKSKP